METTESRRGFGTTVLVLLLALAFLVGTALFVYVGYQLLAPGARHTALADTPTPTVTATPTATRAPTATRQPTATAATKTPVPTVPRPTATSSGRGGGDMPQTGLGPIASVGSLLLASIAMGARWLRRRR